jgi:hypothetical protein
MIVISLDKLTFYKILIISDRNGNIIRKNG